MRDLGIVGLELVRRLVGGLIVSGVKFDRFVGEGVEGARMVASG